MDEYEDEMEADSNSEASSDDSSPDPSARLPADQPASMLPVAPGFDRELRVRLVELSSGTEADEEFTDRVYVPCFKPAQPAVPTAEELRLLAPLVLKLQEVLSSQQLCFDAEVLKESFEPIYQLIHDKQGIRVNTVDLSLGAITALFGSNGGEIALVEVPDDLRQLTEVRELRVACSALRTAPVWLGELVNLEVLYLDAGDRSGFVQRVVRENYSVTLEALLSSLSGLAALKHLTLKGFDLAVFQHLAPLPALIERLTSLKTLHIEDFRGLEELPCFERFTALQELTLKSFSKLAQLPAIGVLTNLTTLDLNRILQLTQLPPCFGQLTSLTKLCLSGLLELEELPGSIKALTRMHTLQVRGCSKLASLPASIVVALSALKKLSLWNLRKLTSLPKSIGALTALTMLDLRGCALRDVPSSIELLTKLQVIRLWIPAEVDGRAFKTLATLLPALRLLEHLDIGGLGEDDVLSIGRSLKAWPLPLLENTYQSLDLPIMPNEYLPINLKQCWQTLGLLPEAAGWDDTEILEHWRLQQQKVVAFAGGLHVRLGSASRVSSLNDVALVLIADEVLGGWSLLKLWQRQRMQYEAEPASSST